MYKTHIMFCRRDDELRYGNGCKIEVSVSRKACSLRACESFSSRKYKQKRKYFYTFLLGKFVKNQNNVYICSTFDWLIDWLVGGLTVDGISHIHEEVKTLLGQHSIREGEAFL